MNFILKYKLENSFNGEWELTHERDAESIIFSVKETQWECQSHARLIAPAILGATRSVDKCLWVNEKHKGRWINDVYRMPK